MRYIDIDTLELVSRQYITARHPETSFPPVLTREMLEGSGFAVLEYDDHPDLGQDEVAEPGEIRIEDGRAYQSWTVVQIPEPAIHEVTMRQARLALLQSELLHLVDGAIDSMDEPARSAARIEWEYSQTVERHRPFVQQLGAVLELTDEQMDDLFKMAAAL